MSIVFRLSHDTYTASLMSDQNNLKSRVEKIQTVEGWEDILKECSHQNMTRPLALLVVSQNLVEQHEDQRLRLLSRLPGTIVLGDQAMSASGNFAAWERGYWVHASMDQLPQLIDGFHLASGAFCGDSLWNLGVIVKWALAIGAGRRSELLGLQPYLSSARDYPGRAYYAEARTFEALGQFQQAWEAYRKSLIIEPWFTSSLMGWIENGLLLERSRELCEYMEGSRHLWSELPSFALMFAIVSSEAKKFEQGEASFEQALNLEGDHSWKRPASMVLKLLKGDIKGALGELTHLDNIGPYMAVRLNETAVKLAQAQKFDIALALYDRIHTIVRAELKYKVSLNAALACFRRGDLKRSLDYCQQCENEYGQGLEKVQKIRHAIHQNQKLAG